MRGLPTGSLLLMISLIAAGCGDDSEPAEKDGRPAADSRPASPGSSSPTAEEPSGSTSFSYLLSQSCGYSPHGTWAVVERDGAIRSVELVTKGSWRVKRRDVPTLDDLLAMARKARPQADVDVYQDDAGLPVYVGIDVPRSTDEELCYTVSELDVLDGDEPPGSTGNVDLTGRWRLLSADVGNGEVTLPQDLPATLHLAVRGWPGSEITYSEAQLACDVVSLVPHRLDGSDVSLEHLDEGSAPECSRPTTPPPLPVRDYFDALGAVDHAERTVDSLVLTGPDVSLTFEHG